MRNLLPLFAYGMLSCGQMQPGDDQAMQGLREQSGTRLRRQFWVADDGTTAPTGVYYDTKLRVSCTFQPTDGVTVSGRWLCLPPGTRFPVEKPQDFVGAQLGTD